MRVTGVLLALVLASPGTAAPPPPTQAGTATPPPARQLSPPPATDQESTPSGSSEALLASPTTRDHIGRVVVPVMVNGQGPFRFIVDTGASHSTVSPGLVQTLGLKPSDVPSIILDGITGSAPVSSVTIDKLQVGALTLEGQPMPVVWAPVLAGADGILGTAGFDQQSLWVDFQRNRVVISGEVESAGRAESMRVHGLRLTDGLLTVDTHIGRVRVRAVVDTGSERTLGNLALRDAINIKHGAGTMVRLTSVYGATRQVETGEVIVAPIIAIESLRVTDVQLVYGDFHIFKVWGMQDKPAMIIGMDVLGTVTALGIDFKNQDVYLASARLNGNTLGTPRGYTAERVSH